MTHFKFFALFAIAVLGFTSCDDDDKPTLLKVESNKVVNLYAPQESDYTTNPPTVKGDFVKFDFSSGKQTTSKTDWDIAFRGTTIIVNGGSATGLTSEPERTGNAAAYITNNTFAEVSTIDDDLFKQDSDKGLAIPTGSGNGWYSYDPSVHAIKPISGKIIVFRTRDNRYARVEIISYYKDAPANPNQSNEARYYTFNYVYQPNNGVKTFE